MDAAVEKKSIRQPIYCHLCSTSNLHFTGVAVILEKELFHNEALMRMRVPRQTGHSSSASSSDLSSSGRLHSSSFFLYNTTHLLYQFLDFTFCNSAAYQEQDERMKQRICWNSFFSYGIVLMTLYSELFLSRSSISCLTSSTFSWCEAVTCSQGQYYKLVCTGTFSFIHLAKKILPIPFLPLAILFCLLAPSLPSSRPSILIVPSTKASPHHLFTWRFFRLPMEYTDNKRK